MSKYRFPFRLGSTSYVYEDDILPNVRRLARMVDDVELVLFEVDEYCNLPDPATVDELKRLAAAHGMTYTVHLPLDLRLAASDAQTQHPSIEKALKVIHVTRPLTPWAYVLHLDGDEPLAAGTATAWARWRDESVRALEQLVPAAGDPSLLCAENLERYPPDHIFPVLERLPVSLCLDVGHLWVQHRDPLPYLRTWLSRTRVVHLHGVAERDHKSLLHAPPRSLRGVLDELYRRRYEGVVTLEVFNQHDFFSSREVLRQWMGSVRPRK